MSIRLMIPNAVPAIDRVQILARIRRDMRDLDDVMAYARASAVVPLIGWKAAIKRMRSLIALEGAWLGVQLNDQIDMQSEGVS